jgi:hypothetical protein
LKPIYYGILAIALFCVGQVVYGSGNATPIINTFNCFSSAGGKICAPTSHSTIKIVGVVNTPGTKTITITPGSVGAASAVAFNSYTSVDGGRATRAEVTSGILSMSSSPTAPTTTSAHNPFWCDTSTSPPTLRIRNGANTGWIAIGTLTDSGLVFWATNAVNATNAGNSTTVGTYAPSTRPAASQIPVNDANGFHAFSNYSANTFANYSTHGIKVPTPPASDSSRHAVNSYFVGRAITNSIPVWTTPTFSSTNFLGSGNTWTVVSGNVAYNRYYIEGKRMHWILSLTGSSVTSGGNGLDIYLPTLAHNTVFGYIGSFVYSDNGTYGQGLVYSYGGTTTYFTLYKNFALTNWTASTGNTAIIFNLEFEIQ